MTRVHNVYCFIIGQAKTDPWAVTHTDNNIDILYIYDSRSIPRSAQKSQPQSH